MGTNKTNRRNRGPHVHLNLNVRGMGVSATMGINERCAELREEGHQVFKLGLGQSPFPVPRCVVEELRANAWRKDYLPVRGLRELREAVATITGGSTTSTAPPPTFSSGRAPRS